jgi:hypothetical protein
MKHVYFCLVVVFTLVISCLPSSAEFLPRANGEQFGLKYGETIAGIPTGNVSIDGKLDDWKYAVWIAFDSEDGLLRGRGIWKDKDDLSILWSTMYDQKNFYFAAAVRDDIFKPSDNAAEMWRGDCIFLYIDWANQKSAISSKPNFALVKGKPTIADPSALNPRIIESEIAIVQNAALGKGGTIYEVAMPFEFITKEKIDAGVVIGFTPGYEDGTDNPEGKGEMFMDWNGLNPDEAKNLGSLKFGGQLPVNPAGNLTTTWGRVKL